MPCVICDNTGWVCEGHGNHPWRGVSNRPDSCDFGPGMPCPSSTCEHSLDRCDGDDNAALRGENERLKAALGGLLAIIHRDGGHHTDAVGEKQSVEDAHQVWAKLLAEVERLRAALEKISEYEIEGGCPCNACQHSAIARAALEEKS